MRAASLRLLAGVLAASSVTAPVGQAQQAGRTGQVDLLYIRGEWSDKAMAHTDAEWQAVLSDIDSFAETYWVYHSSGAVTSFAGTITPRLTMSGAAPTSENPGDPGAIGSELASLAEDAGYNLDDFDHLILSYPSVAHTYSFGALGTPGRIWIPGSNPWGPGYTHEVGHAFGVGHASHWEGGTSILPGEHREGRDGLFMEGSEGGAIGIPPLNIGRSTINMPMRYKMGHVGAENIQFVTTSGVVRIYEFELPAVPEGKMLAARVPVGGTVPGDWWISFCPTMVERWADYNSGGFANGVIVQQLSGEITRSLDFTPQSQGGIGTNEEDYVDSRDGALTVGNSFMFPGTDLTIEPLATGTTDGLRWIEVAIDLGAQSGPLLLREEFDGYQPGSIIGQTGQGFGQSGAWDYKGTAGSFELGPGLSGANGLVVNADGTDALDARISHTVPGWGSGVLYMSYLWNETDEDGHAYVSGGGGFPGAFGHAWSRNWAINNSSDGVGYSYDQTYRLVARIDWENDETTMWADSVSEASAPVASKNEVQGGTPELILRYYGTDGTIDDIRIGRTFKSVVGGFYAGWAASNGASASPGEDSNNNGVPNGCEFFMGGTAASPATLPPLVDHGGGVSTWVIPYDALANADWKFQTSADLSNWSDFQEGDPEVQVLSDPDRLELTLPPVSPDGGMFFRLAVAIP